MKDKTKEGILNEVYVKHYKSNYKTDYSKACILEAMQLYSDQQTASLTSEITRLESELKQERERRENILESLINVQSDYIKLLGSEVDKNASYLYVHGIKCSPEVYEEGKRLREEINKLKLLLPLPEPPKAEK